MVRASRHCIPGFIWHITHRCHKREFLFRFRKDRYRRLHWFYQARKRYGITILIWLCLASINVLVRQRPTIYGAGRPLFVVPVGAKAY